MMLSERERMLMRWSHEAGYKSGLHYARKSTLTASDLFENWLSEVAASNEPISYPPPPPPPETRTVKIGLLSRLFLRERHNNPPPTYARPKPATKPPQGRAG